MMRWPIVAPLLLVTAFAFGVGPTEEAAGFSYEGIRELAIEGETFDVIVQGTRSRLTVLEVQDKPEGWSILHSRSGDRLRVWVDREFSLFARPHRGVLVFHVPGDVNLRIDNTTGDIRVRTLRSDSVAVGATTGSIELEDVAADIRAEATTGGIEIADCAGGLTVATTTGPVALLRSTGDMNVRSSTGPQSYRDVIGDLQARSSTGRIEIDSIQGTLDLVTSTGSQSGRDVMLTGDSSFESSTGDIEMDFTNEVEQLQFDLKSTTGSLQVGSDRSQRELFLSGTGFTVTGRSSTGSQRYE